MIATLKRRSEFQRVRGGGRWSTATFVLEGKPRPGTPPDSQPRFGFTVTKQLGNAVVRNRIRRRLREAVRLEAPRSARPEFDYVLIARSAALACLFADLQRDLATAFERVHQPPRAKRRDTTS